MTTAEYDDAMARARAALAVLKRAAPLPKPPAALKGDALTFSLPMRFALK